MSTASHSGVTFRLSHIPHVLRGEAWQCLFCGWKSRTCTEATREEAMRKHADRIDHVIVAPYKWHEAALESPNFVPAELAPLAARDYQRVNR